MLKKVIKIVDEFLKEYNLKMHHQPFKPTYLYFVQKMNKVNNDWKDYVGL